MAVRYNFFKENEFAPIGSLIGANNPSSDFSGNYQKAYQICCEKR
jgi:hypothetical protein